MNYSRKQMFCPEVVPVLSWLTYLTVIDRLTVVPGQNRDKKIRKLLKNEKNEVKYQRVRSRRLPSANPSLTATQAGAFAPAFLRFVRDQVLRTDPSIPLHPQGTGERIPPHGFAVPLLSLRSELVLGQGSARPRKSLTLSHRL